MAQATTVGSSDRRVSVSIIRLVRAAVADESHSGTAMCCVHESVVIVDINEEPGHPEPREFPECFCDRQYRTVLYVPAETVHNGAIHGYSSLPVTVQQDPFFPSAVCAPRSVLYVRLRNRMPWLVRMTSLADPFDLVVMDAVHP